MSNKGQIDVPRSGREIPITDDFMVGRIESKGFKCADYFI